MEVKDWTIDLLATASLRVLSFDHVPVLLTKKYDQEPGSSKEVDIN